MERRRFLQATGAVLAAGPVSGWAEAGGKALQLSVREYGAVADGATKDTAAFQRTIDRVSVFGGGEVLVPAGTYLIGAIRLRTGVVLLLAEGAVLMGSADMADYPVSQVRWEGKWIDGHVGLIYALDAERIGVVGPGRIMGNRELGGRPTKESPLRHPAMIEPIGCKGVRFEGFSTDYYRMWSLHPTNCEDVQISGLTIRSTGGNGDGIDVDSCKRVKIDRCDIATGDDCISIKSGRGSEGFTLLRTSEDIEITNCTFADSIFACIGIGSETSGGIRNVRVRHCTFTGAKTFAVYIKSRPGRGAFVEDITVEDVEASGMTQGFLRFNLLGSGLQDEVPVGGLVGIPTSRNFRFTNVRVKECPVLVDGTAIHPAKPLEGFVLEHVTGECGKGIMLANVRGAVIRDVRVTGFSGPLLSVANVSGTGLEGAVEIAAPDAGKDVPVGAYELKS